MTVKDVNEVDFESEVLSSEIPVLVDFWASWCAPCKTLAPVLEELSKDLTGKVKIVKVNVEQNKELAMKFNVKGIPNLFLLKDSKVVSSKVGSSDKDSLKVWIESNI